MPTRNATLAPHIAIPDLMYYLRSRPPVGAPLIVGTQRLQPARDPQDVRYWPRSEGGTGFRRDPGTGYQFSALRTYDQSRNLMADDTQSSMEVTALPVTRDYSPDTVRSRARAALVLAVKRVTDTLEDTDNELKLNELAPTIAALGRISGVQLEEQKTGDIRIHIVRDALPMPDHARPLYIEGGEVAQAIPSAAPKDMGHNDLPLLASPSAAPHALREASDVTDCAPSGYDDDA